MNDRSRLIGQAAVAIVCLIGGLVYPISAAIANFRTAGQVTEHGRAFDPIIYDPPAYLTLASLILLPIGVIVGFFTLAEMTALRRRNRSR